MYDDKLVTQVFSSFATKRLLAVFDSGKSRHMASSSANMHEGIDFEKSPEAETAWSLCSISLLLFSWRFSASDNKGFFPSSCDKSSSLVSEFFCSTSEEEIFFRL